MQLCSAGLDSAWGSSFVRLICTRTQLPATSGGPAQERAARRAQTRRGLRARTCAPPCHQWAPACAAPRHAARRPPAACAPRPRRARPRPAAARGAGCACARSSITSPLPATRACCGCLPGPSSTPRRSGRCLVTPGAPHGAAWGGKCRQHGAERGRRARRGARGAVPGCPGGSGVAPVPHASLLHAEPARVWSAQMLLGASSGRGPTAGATPGEQERQLLLRRARALAAGIVEHAAHAVSDASERATSTRRRAGTWAITTAPAR